MTQETNLKDSTVLNTTNIFGAPFGTFITILVTDKIPHRVVEMGLLALVAMLGYIYPLQTNILLMTLIGPLLVIFVYIYVCYALVMYVSEIWPTEAKLHGSGLTDATGRISGIVASYAAAVLLSSYGVTGISVLLGAASVTVAIAIATIRIEAKGISVEGLGTDAIANK